MKDPIVCVECSARPDVEASGWQAHLLDVDDDGQDEIVYYCPSCAARAFGRAQP